MEKEKAAHYSLENGIVDSFKTHIRDNALQCARRSAQSSELHNSVYTTGKPVSALAIWQGGKWYRVNAASVAFDSPDCVPLRLMQVQKRITKNLG